MGNCKQMYDFGETQTRKPTKPVQKNQYSTKKQLLPLCMCFKISLAFFYI